MPLHPETSLDARGLISTLQPALAEGNLSDALETVRKNWTIDELIRLLSSRNADVRKVAALALGFIGDRSAIPPLAVALHDQDELVTQVAEHALWCLWFRLGKPASVALVRLGSSDLGDGDFDGAIEKFTRSIAIDPSFAEAYNQRAIANYLAERYEASIADCQGALRLMPQHFGAMSGMGHCYAHMKNFAEARRCYRLALAIHPRLEGVETSLRRVEQILKMS
jgi:tetratricopeptide (TPR) repeat protein